MGQLRKRVFLAGKEDETHIGFAELLQGPILYPALMHRNSLVLAAEEDQGRRADALETIERRFEEVEKWIVQRRSTQIIAIKSIAKLAIGPIADVFDVAGAGNRRLVARRPHRQKIGQNRAVGPAG